MPDQFRVAATHPISLASGQMAGPGQVVTLKADDQKDEHNQQLMDEKQLVKLVDSDNKKVAEARAKAAPKKKEEDDS